MIASFISLLEDYRSLPAVSQLDGTYSYGQLLERVHHWRQRLPELGVARGNVVGLRSDFSFEAISALLALFSNGNVVSMLPTNAHDVADLLHDSGADSWIDFTASEEGVCHLFDEGRIESKLLDQLRIAGTPGFVIFSSGSTGQPKAVLHDLGRFLHVFEGTSKRFGTLAFLLFDHIAGLDTLFYTLHAGGRLVLPDGRHPETICRLIETFKVQVLPASPSFLNLLCLSGCIAKFDLSSLEIITYGSEPMNPATLRKVREYFPKVKLIQKYGTSEFGSPRTKSRGDDSLWIHLGSENFKVKVIDGLLWVKSGSTMLGYLNCSQPEQVDGWICTGDQVEVDGDWFKILGRQSQMINVGGEKVFPAEVENVIQQMDCVVDVAVAGEPHAIMGNLVAAKVLLVSNTDPVEAKKQIRKYCTSQLARYKVPMKIAFVTGSLTSDRQKKVR